MGDFSRSAGLPLVIQYLGDVLFAMLCQKEGFRPSVVFFRRHNQPELLLHMYSSIADNNALLPVHTHPGIGSLTNHFS